MITRERLHNQNVVGEPRDIILDCITQWENNVHLMNDTCKYLTTKINKHKTTYVPITLKTLYVPYF